MDYKEQEKAVEELEQRIERLRSLYEQYFLGIERIEPLVARKDVDRRIWLLRREQIRNTGLRFRMQQTISRYNTFITYWQRVVREIENGTYRRDLFRAAKRFGSEPLTLAAKRRLGRNAIERAAQASDALVLLDEPEPLSLSELLLNERASSPALPAGGSPHQPARPPPLPPPVPLKSAKPPPVLPAPLMPPTPLVEKGGLKGPTKPPRPIGLPKR